MRKEDNTRTAVAAAPTGTTVKVTARLCANGVPAGQRHPASVNATIAAFGLTPAGPGSIHSPNA